MQENDVKYQVTENSHVLEYLETLLQKYVQDMEIALFTINAHVKMDLLEETAI